MTKAKRTAEQRYREEIEREKSLVKWLDGEGINELNKFDRDFRVFRPDDRHEEIFLKENNVLIPVLPKKIKSEMRRQINESILSPSSIFNMKYKELTDPLKEWIDCTARKRLNEYPQPVGFKSSPWECFNRLPWDPIPCTEKEMEMQCQIVIGPMRQRIVTNRNALDLRMGSLSDIDSNRKQMVYLWGEYDAGKSFIMNHIIFKLAGGHNGVLPMRPAQMLSPHFSHAFIRKAVIVVHECPPSFMIGEEFKTITGENRIAVNPKGKDVFVADLRALIFAASNKPPEIPSDPALRRRIIDCEILNIAKGDILQEKYLLDQLEHELKYYMGYCIEKWNEFKASGQVQIPTGESIEQHIENYESAMDVIFHRYFSHNPAQEKPTLTVGEMLLTVQQDLYSARISKEQFRDFVAQRYFGHTKQTFWHREMQKNTKGVAFLSLKFGVKRNLSLV